MSRAGPTLYIAGTSQAHELLSATHSHHCTGMHGIDPSNNTLAALGLLRVRQAYDNMATLANMAGADLTSSLRLVVYVTDLYRYRPMCSQAQEELWGEDGPHPPRTIVEMDRLNEDDVVEVDGTFWLGE